MCASLKKRIRRAGALGLRARCPFVSSFAPRSAGHHHPSNRRPDTTARACRCTPLARHVAHAPRPTAPVVLRKYGPKPLRAAQREQHQDVLVRARDASRSLKALDPGCPSSRLAVQDAHVLGLEELQPARVQAHRGLGGGSVRRGHGGRTPAPVRKPVVEVGGGALGPVRHLQEPLPRAVLKQQQPVLLGYAAAAVALGGGGGKSEAAPKGWGSLHPCERGPSSRSLKDLTADCKGTNDQTPNSSPRAQRDPFEALGGSRGSMRHCPAPQYAALTLREVDRSRSPCRQHGAHAFFRQRHKPRHDSHVTTWLADLIRMGSKRIRHDHTHYSFYFHVPN